MSILVLSQSSPETYLVIINDINLEATVTNRSDIAAAWINNTNPIDNRRLIVGISTNEKYGTIPPPISSPAKTEAGCAKSPVIFNESEIQPVRTLSESKDSIDPSFLSAEIGEIGDSSLANLSNLANPTDLSTTVSDSKDFVDPSFLSAEIGEIGDSSFTNPSNLADPTDLSSPKPARRVSDSKDSIDPSFLSAEIEEIGNPSFINLSNLANPTDLSSPQNATTLSESKDSIDPSSVFLPAEIEEIGNPSFTNLSNHIDLSSPQPNSTLSESKDSIHSSFLSPEIEEIGNPSSTNLSNLPAPIDPSSTQTATTQSDSKDSINPSSVPPPAEIDEIGNPSAPINPSLKSFSGRTATLQLCCGNRCLVFSLLHNDGGIPDALIDFLFDRNQVTLVGAGVRRGGDWLGRSAPMLVCRDPWELGEARARRGLRRLNTLDRLAGRLLGKKKAIRVEKIWRWDRWPLTENQMAVACLEAYLLSQIGEKMVEINREAFHCCLMSSL